VGADLKDFNHDLRQLGLDGFPGSQSAFPFG
jgi:hypothetical protein